MSSVDDMAARLASSLAIAEGKKQVDLRPTQGEGLRQSEVFMVGKLLTARDFKLRSFLGMFRNAWRINGSLQVEEAEGQRILFTLSDPTDRVRIWKGAPWGYNHAPVALACYDGVMPVEKVPLTMASYWITLQGIPPAFRSERVMTMIGYTLGDFQEIDKVGKKAGKLHIRVEIPLNKPLPFKLWYWVEDEVKFLCKFKYDKLFGRCSICGLVTHVGLPCSGPALEEDDDGAEKTVLGAQNAAATPATLAGGLQLHSGSTASSSGTPSGGVSGLHARVLGHGQTLVFKTPIPNPIPGPSVVSFFTRPRRQVVIRELQESAMTPERITGKRRGRSAEGVTISPKKLKLSLAVGKRNLNLEPESLGLVSLPKVGSSGNGKRKRGRLAGSKDKLPYGEKKKGTEKDETVEVQKASKKDKVKKATAGMSSNSKGKELVINYFVFVWV
ncbi:hypothetical protein ABKV19_012706 [Rosa sericea]